MSGPSFRDALRAHYDAKRLPAPDAARILEGPRGPAGSPWRWVAAVVAAAIVAGVLVHALRNPPGPRGDATLEVVREIAWNHRKALDAEFLSSSWGELSERMSKLDFALREPRRTAGDLRLRGARYCSLAGAIAAQVKLRDPGGLSHTLYQVRAEGPLRAVRESVFRLEDVEIRLWREGGVLMGLAGPPAER